MNSIISFIDAGGILMWVLIADAVLLYVLLAERLLTLFAPNTWKTQRHQEMHTLLGRHRLQQAQEEAAHLALAEHPELTRFFSLIRALITIAPLLGLLGTVGGMIGTFEGIMLGNRIQAASHGIAEALLTTQCGLLIAAPALLIEQICLRRSTILSESPHRALGMSA